MTSPASVPYQGDAVTVSAQFTNAAGEATDPTTCTFNVTVYDPSTGSVLVPEVSYLWTRDNQLAHDSAGAFHVVLDTTNSPGRWRYEFIGTGAVADVITGEFTVRTKTP